MEIRCSDVLTVVLSKHFQSSDIIELLTLMSGSLWRQYLFLCVYSFMQEIAGNEAMSIISMQAFN